MRKRFLQKSVLVITALLLAAGLLLSSAEGVSVGVSAGCVGCSGCFYPMVYINAKDGCEPVERYSDGRIKTAKTSDGTHTYMLFTSPSDITVDTARNMLESAGVHTYAPKYCVVHADNRFIYVLSEKTQTVTITLKSPTTCENVFTNEIYENIQNLTLDMEEGTCVFLKYR